MEGGHMEAIKEKETQLVRYDITDAAIAEMKQQYLGLKIKDGKSYEIVRKAIGDVRSKRTAVERRRKELKEDAIKWGKLIDGEAKRITTVLLDIEEPLKVEKQRVDDEKAKEKEEKERVERERVQGIQQQIEAIRSCVMDIIGKTSEEIQDMIDGVELENITEERFQEFTFEAVKIKDETIQALHKALESRSKWEQEELGRKLEGERLEKIRQEQEERQRCMDLEEKQRRETLRQEQEDIETAKATLEKEKARMEAEKQAEKEAKEKAEMEAQEAKEREKKEVAEKERQEKLKPDKDKIEDYANDLMNLKQKPVESNEAKELATWAFEQVKSLAEAIKLRAEML